MDWNVVQGNDTMYGSQPVSPGPTAIVVNNTNGAIGFTVQTFKNTTGLDSVGFFIRQYMQQGSQLRGAPYLTSAYDGILTYSPDANGQWNPVNSGSSPQPWQAPDGTTVFKFAGQVKQFTIIPQALFGTDEWQTTPIVITTTDYKTYDAVYNIGSGSLSVVITMQLPTR